MCTVSRLERQFATLCLFHAPTDTGVGARNRCQLSNWRFNPETVHFLGLKTALLADFWDLPCRMVLVFKYFKYITWGYFGLCLLKTCFSSKGERKGLKRTLTILYCQLLENRPFRATKIQKNPRAHKNKIGTPPPPKPPKTPPPKRRNFMDMLFPAERAHFSRRP